MAAKKKWKPNICKCIDLLSKELDKRHCELLFAFGFKGEVRMQVATEKKMGAPRGTQVTRVICTYCPICGKKYPPFWSPKAKKPTKRDIEQARKFGAPKVDGKFV